MATMHYHFSLERHVVPCQDVCLILLPLNLSHSSCPWSLALLIEYGRNDISGCPRISINET